MTMSRAETTKRKAIFSETGDSNAQRPQGLLRRLSSGFSSMMPSFGAGKAISRQNSNQRSKTAPNLRRTVIPKSKKARDHVISNERKGILPTILIPTFSDPNRPCPYDPSTYHSFPNIEESECSLCGLKRPSSTASGFHSTSQPCSECRSKSPFSHLALSGQRSRAGRRSSLVQNISVTFSERASSPDLGPRLVPAAIAAKRIGNPPRKAQLPIPRIPVLSKPPSTSPNPFTIQDAGHVIGFGELPVSRPGHEDMGYDGSRPISPKLHHIHLLPHASDYPYIHKSEVEQHLAALRAGAPSPLETITDKAYLPRIPGVPDYADTVYYGPTISPVSASSSPQSQRPEPTRKESTASSISTSSTPRVGGRRIELRGGCRHHDIIPRLRGGCREGHTHHVRSFVFKLKTWLLTGSWRSYGYDTDSDTDLPPVRTLNPARVARVAHHSCRRVPLPASVSKTSFPTPPRRLSAAPSQTSKNGGVAFPTCLPNNPRILSCTPPIPCLRGGAGAPRSLLDTDRVPPMLYFLAGGTRRPVTVSSWKKERPKRRVGGFLGLLLYGRYAGCEYGDGSAGREGGDRKEVETGVAASNEVTLGNGAAADNGTRAAPQENAAPATLVSSGENRAEGGAAGQQD